MKIPAAVTDNTPTPFPVGVYIGELADIEHRESTENGHVFLRMNFVSNNPADDNTGDPGNRILRDDACIRYAGESLFDYEEITDDTPFLLRRGAGLLSGLALAVGAVDRGPEGVVDIDLPSFVHDLEEGEYAGEKVKFQVEHNTYKKKDAPENEAPQTNAQVRRFAPAV